MLVSFLSEVIRVYPDSLIELRDSLIEPENSLIELRESLIEPENLPIELRDLC